MLPPGTPTLLYTAFLYPQPVRLHPHYFTPLSSTHNSFVYTHTTLPLHRSSPTVPSTPDHTRARLLTMDCNVNGLNDFCFQCVWHGMVNHESEYLPSSEESSSAAFSSASIDAWTALMAAPTNMERVSTSCVAFGMSTVVHQGDA